MVLRAQDGTLTRANQTWHRESGARGYTVSWDTLKVLQPEKEMDEPASARGEKQMSTQKLVCMEHVETLLVAENVFCNGLSTIAINGFTRVSSTVQIASKKGPEEVPSR